MKKANKILSVFLSLLIVFSIIPMSSIEAEAASVTLAQLQSQYPHGKYWNGGNANSYTSTPCNHHGSCSYSGSCGCNSFKGYAIQCMGFAYQLAYLVYGGNPYTDWTANRNSSALNSLKPGDVVRYKNDGHSIFVTGVSGETVTYADCNSDGHCKIRWNQTITKSTLKSTFTYVDPAPYAWDTSVESHKIDSNYGKNFTAYPKAKITAENIFDANHSQISSSAWIGTSDECTIHEVYTDGCCKVSYPLDDGGTKTIYSKIYLFDIHTHSYSANYEAAHPHRIYMKCSCGDWYYTGEYKTVSSCSSCQAPSGYHMWFDGGTVYYIYDTITVNAESNNAKEYKFVFTFPSGQEGSTDWMTSGKYSVYASEAGTYKVSYLAKNDYGTYDARKDGCTLTFYYVAPTISISNSTSVSLKVGNTHQIKLTTDTGTDTDITYSSSNTGVATVSSSGLVTAKSSGTSTITAKLVYHGDNGDYTTSCKMTVSVSDKTYTVRFNANGGSGTMSNQSFTYGASKVLTANAFTRTGYTFLGWSTSSTATSATYTDKQSVKNLTSTDGGTVTLYAVWKANTYTVKYNANGGTGSMSNSSHTYDVSKSLTSNAFTRSGYTFLGWSTSASATSATYTNGQSVKNLTATNGGTVNLYAVWKSDSSSITADSSYSANISTGGEVKYYTFTPSSSGKYVIYSTGTEDTEVILYNSSGTELDSNDDGGSGNNFRLEYNLIAGTTYRFGVRYYNSSKTGTIPFTFGRVYNVTYYANGGTGAPSSQSKDYGATLILSSTVPTRTGYTFLGWSTSSTATSATYSAGGTFTSNANTSLYAVWKANESSKPSNSYGFEIQQPSRTTIRHKDGIKLHTNIDGTAPAGSYVVWTASNGNFSKSADGSNLKIIAKNKGYTTFTAVLYDADGNELTRDSVELYSNSGFFQKIGGFFRSLFGSTKIYEN